MERAKVYGNPADVILALAANHHPDDAERLLRAYVNGWTVEKPKRYVLPMEGTVGGAYDDSMICCAIMENDHWEFAYAANPADAGDRGFTVTQADIDLAPDWVKAITPVEVTDDEQ